MLSAWNIVLLAAIAPFVAAFTTTTDLLSTSTRTTSRVGLGAPTTIDDIQDDISPENNRRRSLLTTTLSGILGTTAALGLSPIQSAEAAATNSKEVLNNLLVQLRSVPTFCLVNGEGIPYMVIKQQERIAKGYAFTSMEGAITVLNDAQRTAKEKGYFDIWESATIITLPGDVAVRLALQKRERATTRGTGSSLDSIVDLIPTTENRDAAMMIDKRGFQDQGKVPLFYVEGLKAGDGNTMPLFLQKSALIKEWQLQRPSDTLPPIQAMDITYMLEAALRGYVNKVPNEGDVVFVPDPEQVQIAQKLRKEGLTMYKFDKMVV